MSSKISLILSSIFIVIFFAFGIDLLNIQFAYTTLDSDNTIISYQISKRGALDPDFEAALEKKYNIEIECLTNRNPLFGEQIDYLLIKDINTLVLPNNIAEVKIKRSAVIGYFN